LLAREPVIVMVVLQRRVMPLADTIRIERLADLDSYLARIDQPSTLDDDLRRELARIRLVVPDAERLRGIDPFVPAYRKVVLELLEGIRGSVYTTEREGLDIDVENELRWGFPYGTQSFATVSGYLIAYGHLIRTMQLPAGAEILELGCGTGSLTQHLARMGYRITCVDLNESNLELIRRATAPFAVSAATLRADLNDFEPDHPVDAVVFFESLHHCLNHATLLERAKRWLTPNGILVLGAEPILPTEAPILPYPWGPRLDGESLRAIRRFGWMELGFTEPYLFTLLKRTGWRWERFRSAESHWADVIVARRSA
jgi:SAM-dependent methyltransferase